MDASVRHDDAIRALDMACMLLPTDEIVRGAIEHHLLMLAS